MRLFFLLFFFLFFATFNLQANIVVLNGLTHIHKVEKGQIYKGKIDIQNTGTSPENIKIYLQDLSYNADGSIYYTSPLTNKQSNSAWIKLNTDLITIKGKEKTSIFYEITVPDSVSEAGSYWSAMIVEPVPAITPNVTKPSVQITSVVRYAIQLIADYKTGNIKPDLKFESIKVENSNQRHLLKIALANHGSIYCKPTVSIEIYDPNSETKIGNFSSQAMSLLPHTSKSFIIDLESIQAGTYNTVIFATDGEENTFALRSELKIKND